MEPASFNCAEQSDEFVLATAKLIEATEKEKNDETKN